LDDTLVKKCGRHIQGLYRWFDHTCGRVQTSLCLVNVSIVVKDQLIFVLPWILRKTLQGQQKKGKQNKEQDAKTMVAIEMVQTFISWLREVNIDENKILVMADAWYANKTMQNFLKKTRANFRFDARSNLSVQIPDHKAIQSRRKKRRGRKRRKFVRYVPLKHFMGSPAKWHYFTDPISKERVFYKKATLTLKAAGRVTVYAFKRESMTRPKFILTRASYVKSTTARYVYQQYQSRWRIEEAHRDLKQQFGLPKCQARQAWVVAGFVALVFFGYTLWKSTSWTCPQASSMFLKCPSWAETFHHEQIYHDLAAVS
ncbi:MAG: transposase, partial [Candidatus Hodarchaeales archaeon]